MSNNPSFLSRRSSGIGLGKAELIGIWLQVMIFGFEALTFVYTIYLLHGTKRNRIQLFNFAALITMFVLGTIHLGSNFRRVLNAFVSTPNDPFPDPEVYLADLAGLLYRLKNIIILIQIAMLDVLLTYRCYIVWDRRLPIVLLPLIGVVLYFVTGVGAIHAFAVGVYTNDTIFTGTPGKWISAAISTTFITKLICLTMTLTGSLVPRKNSSWQAFIRRSGYSGLSYKTLLMTIETGGLAFIGTLILLPVYLARSNAQETMFNTLSPLTGESFILIFISGLLGAIPSNSGPSRTRRQTYNPQKSIVIHPIESKPSRVSSSSIFHFKDKKAASDESTVHPSGSSEEISVKSASNSAKIAPPELVHTTKADPLAYKHTEFDVTSPNQQRHPFALATPISFP